MTPSFPTLRPSELLHMILGEAVEPAPGKLLAQRGVDPLPVAVHPGGEKLDHQQVAITVHHQPGQAVALGMHDTPGIADLIQTQRLAAQTHRLGDTRAEKPGIHRLVRVRSEEHTSELQSLMRISYAVFCLKKKNTATEYSTIRR